MVFFYVLRPDRYGLTPNPTDPIFYTGYAINFDDVMREVGDSRYFVTRWSAYLPSRAFSSLFGPVVGRLILRWLVASAILMSILHLGRRWNWRRSTELVACVVVIGNPIFARAFMTDYVEWLVVSLGIILVCQCLEPKATIVRSMAIGALASLIVISNPIAAALVGAPALFYLYTARRDNESPLWQALAMGFAACIVIVGGLWAFRAAYGIPNVYQPTFDFIRAYAGVRDPHKSPGLEWMGTFIWIYIPLIVLIAAVAVGPVRDLLRKDVAVRGAFLLLSVQYLFQWADQFVRDGLSLEIPYYWSAITPSLAVTLAVLIGSVRWQVGAATAFLGVWIVTLVGGRISDLAFPAGWLFAIVVVAVIGLAAAAVSLSGKLATGTILIFVLACQTAAPGSDSRGPRYDLVFFTSEGSRSDLDLEEVVWLERVLDELRTDDGLFFAPSPSATNVTGVYIPHVTGRLLRSDADMRLEDEAVKLIRRGEVQLLAIYGADEFVRTTLRSLARLPPRNETLLDDTNPAGHQHRLVVVRYQDPADGFVWQASDLYGRTGQIGGSARFAVPDRDEPGWLLHGPYAALEERPYRATLWYSADAQAGPGSITGTFDVALSGEAVDTADIPGTGSERSSVSIDFVGSRVDRWEFRVNWNGASPMTVWSVSIEPLGR